MMSNIPEPGNKSNRVGSGVVWKIEHAHQGVVNSIQFNPFIPYWLASAGMIERCGSVWYSSLLKTYNPSIQARMGLPRYGIFGFCGTPLLAWTVILEA